MKPEVTFEGDEAIVVQSMITEARSKLPALNEMTDGEVIEFLVSCALAKGETT